MLPNVSIPVLEICGPLKIGPFGVLVAIAVFTGCQLAHRRAKRTGWNTEIMVGSMPWAIGVGFKASHWVSEIFSYPDLILENPLTLLMFWATFSSFGGFFGGILGTFVYLRRKKVPVMPYIECMLFGLVPAWIIGRLGCTIVFDHPGLRTDFFLGMADQAGVVRHNLGFYEMLVAIALTAVLYGLKNVRPFEGFHSTLIILLYTPARMCLDNLRVAERTYWGLTIGQYFAIPLLGLGVFLIIRGLKRRTSGPQGPERNDRALWSPSG